jgi:hypothetical protein
MTYYSEISCAWADLGEAVWGKMPTLLATDSRGVGIQIARPMAMSLPESVLPWRTSRMYIK